jgi:hypothetical protein
MAGECMRIKILLIMIIAAALLTSGVVFPKGALCFKGKSDIVLRAYGEPTINQITGDFIIPEKPAELHIKGMVLYTNNSKIKRYQLYRLVVSYYTAPEPAGFEDEFIKKIRRGAVIGINDYCIEGDNITVSIWNTPDWKDAVTVLYDVGPGTFRLPFISPLVGSTLPMINFKEMPMNFKKMWEWEYRNPFTKAVDEGFFRDLPALFPVNDAIKNDARASSLDVNIDYMGLKYRPYNAALLCEGELYSTGQMQGDRMIYVSALCSSRAEKVPELIFLKNKDGSYSCYRLSDDPPAYAYTLSTLFNTNETIGFGIYNDHSGKLELINAAPWEIQKKYGTEWKTIYSPIAAQVIVPLMNNSFREWTWDQKLDDGSTAPFGEYRIVINSKFIAPFKIAKNAPSVESFGHDYNESTGNAAFMDTPQKKAFSEIYSASTFNEALRDELISQMQYKAWVKDLDPKRLKDCINYTKMSGENTKSLPCLAVHAKFEGKPAWIIVYNWGMGPESLSHVKYYVVEESTGKVLHSYGCK